MKKIRNRHMTGFACLLLGFIFVLVCINRNSNTVDATEAITYSPVKAAAVEVIDQEFSVESAEVNTEPQTIPLYDIPLSEDLQIYIWEVCRDYGVNHLVVLGMIERESVFNSNCIGDNGAALGLMQVQPKWHQDRMDKLGATDLLDPYQNVLVGIDYLAEMMAYDNGLDWALMAYNGGPSYANKKADAGEISEYVSIVYDNAESFEIVTYWYL